MRILSSMCDAPTLTPLRHDTKKADQTVNEDAKATNATTSVIAKSTVPTVALDTDVVSDHMAARLCTSFLDHLLFLKSQVPLPVGQLARMPTHDSASRAAKKRHELLSSFDVLASHLYTSFIALSTALALRGVSDSERGQVGTALLHQTHGRARAFVVVAFGPTVGTARSRVIVGIDGLETRVWGLRRDRDHTVTRTRDVLEEGDDDDDSPKSASDDEGKESGDEGSEGGEIEETGSDDASPPPSRSPSPAPSSDSDSSALASQLVEDQGTIRAAERLLSRTLASACTDGDGHGLAAEMAPTQIHVLIRAPRRFDHPSWVPRQNLCTSLDGYLADFLTESGQAPISCDTAAPKKRTKASKVQGVWIKSRRSVIQMETPEQDLAEEDELIWWSWDGKLVGFADW